MEVLSCDRAPSRSGLINFIRILWETMANDHFDDYESAVQHADQEATRKNLFMAVVEDEGLFYVMTMRDADRYARPHPDTVFIVYQAEPQAI